MQTVPLQPVANQQVQAQLNGQACTITIRQFAYGLFVDLTSNDVPIVATVIAQNKNRIVRDAYLGFSGDFVFVDTQGDEDPVYTGLGTRWQLVYLTEDEITAAVAAVAG